MKNYTLAEIESCIYENKVNKNDVLKRTNGPKVKVLNYTQIDDRYIIVETDKQIFEDCFFQTVDIEKGNTIGQVSNSREMQILITLGLKFDGNNSQFAYFARKMLNNFKQED